MADAKGEETVDDQQIPQQLSNKRKPGVEFAADEAAVIQTKKQKPEDRSPDPPPTQEARDGAQADPQKEVGEVEHLMDDGVSSNGKAAVDKGKCIVTAVDKGKGKMVVQEDEEEEGGDDDSDGSDNDDSDDDVVVEEGDYESDFLDDPLTEVDLSNILPSRTRRRGPPPPGAYLVDDLDGDDEDEDEDDDDVCD